MWSSFNTVSLFIGNHWISHCENQQLENLTVFGWHFTNFIPFSFDHKKTFKSSPLDIYPLICWKMLWFQSFFWQLGLGESSRMLKALFYWKITFLSGYEFVLKCSQLNLYPKIWSNIRILSWLAKELFKPLQRVSWRSNAE